MKVIFLDFDGVLNSTETWRKRGKGLALGGPREGLTGGLRGLDPDHVGPLNQIVQESGAKIVISSSWRLDKKLDDMDKLDELRLYLKQAGAECDVIGMTSSGAFDPVRGIGNSSIRGYQIQEWLNDHPEVTHFVILDDSDDMVHLLPKLVQTNDRTGLERRHISEALHHLGVQ